MGIGAAGIHHQEQHVDPLERSGYFVHHLASQRRIRIVQPRRIDKNDLSFGLGDNSLNAVSGGLRLGSDDGDFLPKQAIHECGLSGVGAAYDGYESRLEAGAKWCGFSWLIWNFLIWSFFA